MKYEAAAISVAAVFIYKDLMRATTILLLALCLIGCTGSLNRTENAIEISQSYGWNSYLIDINDIAFRVFQSQNLQTGKPLTIFIEGDGLVANKNGEISIDPTPRNPVGLKLALAHPESNAVYIGRPCQYIADNKRCSVKYWTTHRYSAEVVTAYNKMIDRLKKKYNASHITLVGYSGGGAIAVLVAAYRSDVSKLVTVAGNLDTELWSKRNEISLTGSSNPRDVASRISNINQTHFVGSDDPNITLDIARSFVSASGSSNPKILVVPSFNHSCCWDSDWKRLWAKAID
jgi:alpha/beta hydrolase fold